MRLATLVGVLGWVLVLSACGGDDEGEDLEGGCDITRAACQRVVFEATALARGELSPKMPKVRTTSVEEFEEWLERTAADDDDEAAEVWNRTLPLLSLLPRGSSIADEVVGAAVAGVAAYYDPASKLVTVLERGPTDPLDDTLLLSHEFVHSLQDASLDLREFREQRVSSLDSSVAVASLVEGEAMLISFAVLVEALNRPGGTLNWSGVLRTLRESTFDTIGRAPAPLFTAVQSLPYLLGMERLYSSWSTSGQSAIDEFYEDPPLSVLDWVPQNRPAVKTRVEALDCFPTAGPPGFVGYDSDVFGVTGLLAVGLARGDAVESAWTAAVDVRGDRLVVFRHESEADVHAIAWRIRFASAPAAQQFGTRVTPLLGASAAVLVQDREVVFYGATRPEELSAWTDAGRCGTADELPVGADASESVAAALRRARRGRVALRQ